MARSAVSERGSIVVTSPPGPVTMSGRPARSHPAEHETPICSTSALPTGSSAGTGSHSSIVVEWVMG
jgi:hypothetical protein